MSTIRTHSSSPPLWVPPVEKTGTGQQAGRGQSITGLSGTLHWTMSAVHLGALPTQCPNLLFFQQHPIFPLGNHSAPILDSLGGLLEQGVLASPGLPYHSSLTKLRVSPGDINLAHSAIRTEHTCRGEMSSLSRKTKNPSSLIIFPFSSCSYTRSCSVDYITYKASPDLGDNPKG